MVLEQEATEASGPVAKILSALHDGEISKANSILKQTRAINDNEAKMHTATALADWLGTCREPDTFVQVARPFINFVASCSEQVQESLRTSEWLLLLSAISDEKLTTHEECATFLRQAFERLYRKKSNYDLLETWSDFLCINKARITFMFTASIVKFCLKNSNKEERPKWEEFLRKFVDPIKCLMETGLQTCSITVKVEKESTHVLPSQIVVWNGNGMRARWNAENSELKTLIETVGPDILCFLESKINGDKLLALQGFDDFASKHGFKHIFCYWQGRHSHYVSHPLQDCLRHGRHRARPTGSCCNPGV